MTLRKIERYDVTTSEPPDIDGLPGILLAVLGNALGGGGPTLTLYTKGGKTFPMYSIPESIATALGNLKEGKLSRDQFYVIKQLAKKGSDPYNSVQSVDVRIGSDLPECKLSEAIKSGAVLLVAKNKNPQLVYCSTKKRLEGDAESVVKFNDGEQLKLNSVPGGFVSGAMHNAEITYNGKEITYLQMAQLPCGALAAIIDTKNSKTCPVIAGFDASSTQFLAGYSYQSKTHEPISDDPRYSLEQFICEMNSLARQNGVKPSPKRVEINSYVPGTSVLCADVIMSDAPKNKYPMIPSHSLLLAALFNVPAFLDDELYRDE